VRKVPWANFYLQITQVNGSYIHIDIQILSQNLKFDITLRILQPFLEGNIHNFKWVENIKAKLKKKH
jgi:hypothetical protein